MKIRFERFSINTILNLGMIVNAIYFLIPNSVRGINIVISLILFSVYRLRSKKVWMNKEVNWAQFWIFTIPFFINTFVLLVYPVTSLTYRKWETELGLFAFPVLFFLVLGGSVIKIKRDSLRVLVDRSIIYSGVIFLLVMVVNLFVYNDPFVELPNSVFIRASVQHLGVLSLHPMYASLIMGICAILSWFEYDKSGTKYFLVLSSLFGAFVIGLSSKIGMLGLFFIMLVFLRVNYKKVIPIGVLFVALLFISPYGKRFEELFNRTTYSEVDFGNSTSIRMGIWKCSSKLIESNPWGGYGYEQTNVKVSECLYGISTYKDEYNSHNQFLSYWLRNGFFGFLFFSFLILFLFSQAIRYQDKAFSGVLIFFLLYFFVENVLERRNGILLFAFLSSFYSWVNHSVRRKGKNLLFIGPFSPPVTGNSLVNDKVAELLGNKGYRIKCINTSLNSFNDKNGSFSLYKMFFGFKNSLLSVVYLWGNQKVYISIGQTFFGVLKNALPILIGKGMGQEIIIHVHGNELHKTYANGSSLQQWIMRMVVGKCDKGIVLGEGLRHNLTPFMDDSKIFVLINFVDQGIIGSNSEIKNKDFSHIRLVYLSNLMTEKGIFELLDALIRLKNRGVIIPTELHGNIDASLLDRVNACLDQLYPDVQYHGVANFEQKRKAFMANNVFVLPSYNEGLPLAVLESMATGNIVISTKLPGLEGVVVEKKNGWFVNIQDSKSIENVLDLLKNDISNYQWMSVKNWQKAKVEFQEKVFIEGLEEIFNAKSN